LEQFVRIFENIPEFVAARAKRLGGQLRGHLDAGNRPVFRHESNLVDLDARLSRHCGLQLFSEGARF